MRVFHIDLNRVSLRQETLRMLLDEAAACGFDCVLWEVEDKIQWKSCPECVDDEAMSLDNFSKLLAYSRQKGLKPIPLLQTFGHAEYVLDHPKFHHFRELPEHGDCYCPSNLEVRNFLSRWIDEYLELFGDIEFFHLGGDEAYHLGKCPACKNRDLLELYCEHLNTLAQPLLDRQIKPCVWHDVVSGRPWWAKPGPTTKLTLDPRFVVWYWDYRDKSANPFEWHEEIAGLGMEQILTASVQSGGDDPFLVNYRVHAENINAALSLEKSTLGLCISSWSIRMGLKSIQFPLLEQIHKNELLLSPELASAGECPELYWISGMMWNKLKDGVLPPPGYLKSELTKRQSNLNSIIATVQVTLSGLPITLPGNIGVGLALKRRWLNALLLVLTEKIDHNLLSELRQLQDDTEQYYLLEQHPESARRNAQLVFAPLLDYVVDSL